LDPPRILVLGYGNPSRGDDALGPALLDRLERIQTQRPGWEALETLTDFQLQIEHSLDLDHREQVLFVDASLSGAAPFEFVRLQARRDDSYTSHAMSPSALLSVYREIRKTAPPPAHLLAIRGERFALGEAMSPAASDHLEAAERFVVDWLERCLSHPPPRS